MVVMVSEYLSTGGEWSKVIGWKGEMQAGMEVDAGGCRQI